MELKRPGTMKAEDWIPALQGGVVGGDGEKFCRQGVKYAYAWGIPFLCFGDGVSMMFLVLKGNLSDWFHPQRRAESTPAEGAWILSHNQRRCLFIFVKFALKCHLLKWGNSINA